MLLIYFYQWFHQLILNKCTEKARSIVFEEWGGGGRLSPKYLDKQKTKQNKKQQQLHVQCSSENHEYQNPWGRG